MKQLAIEEELKVHYCIPTELRDEQIKINIKNVKGRFQPSSELKEEPIAIVSFGPSLNQTWKQLKKFKNIMTCSGAYKFLVEKGIVPNYHVDLEPRGHKVSMLGIPQKETEFLIASTIHPNYTTYLKEHKANVKLWHIFASEDEGYRVLPRGEYLVTGGSSVGLRCLTLARLMGFTDFHIFGMDGSYGETGSHTTFHPNAPKEAVTTEYKGKIYQTTPSMLFVAKETEKELNNLHDVKYKFYGKGLIQEMSKDFKPSTKRPTDIAYSKPEIISEEYIELNRQLHDSNPSYGMGGSKYADTVLKLSTQLKTTDILDFGCGKRMLQKSLPFPIWNYDPAIPEVAEYPKPARIVICTDVLEHIEPDKLPIVLSELSKLTLEVGYFVISTRKAVKTYSNGINAHLIVQGKDWWEKKLTKFFEVASIIEKTETAELHIVVGKKKEFVPETTTVTKDGLSFVFLTPNDTTKWRANTLFTKEPSTISWIDSIPQGSILFDIGANVGSYSIYSGVKGIQVYAFEPEASNFTQLVRNLHINNIPVNAYCAAISDKNEIGTMFLSSLDLGGACNTFNENVDFKLEKRNSSFSQGSFSHTIDSLVEMGLPTPEYIKIDVDGLEHKVIKGAVKTLASVKSLIVEINPSLEEHRKMFIQLDTLGFTYDKSQVDQAERKSGPFKGCAEYIFYRKPPVTKKELIRYKSFQDSPVINEPFDYMFVEDVFPDGVYSKILKEIDKVPYIAIEKSRNLKGYPERFTGNLSTKYFKELKQELLSGKLKNLICEKFNLEGEFKEDLLLIHDKIGYKIPPHTDTPKKVISALFYLPKDDSAIEEGTTLYVPKKENFVCEKGIHYNFEDFTEIRTLPYTPNSVLIFKRTDNSFHGVTPSKHERTVLLYNLNWT
jgi:FkbM family methyltransferase